MSPTPTYLSTRSAEAILSDIRPTRIKPDALRAVNLLLDELLFLILSAARSISTEKLKTSLLKVLPTNLGKEGLLEAEVELRAYHERTAPSAPVVPLPDNANPAEFPLQVTFELLRMKCEAYSTLSDFDGDGDVESQLQANMSSGGGAGAPKAQAVAPAALYLTAILEHVCEHVLSNVARVVARDSSRTTAHVQDLFVALCEDESIYGLFKTMKVQEQIEQQSKLSKPPRRSRSFSRNDTSSPSPPNSFTPNHINGQERNGSLGMRYQPSEESVPATVPSRSSIDKGKSMAKLFKGSGVYTPPDGHDSAPTVPSKHQRSESALSDKAKRTAASNGDTTLAAELAEDLKDFDDLMMSGTTMKLTLTPDRLQTFEVFAKEKNQRNRPGARPTPSSTSASAPEHSRVPSKGRVAASGLRDVDSIEEREEDGPASPSSRARSRSLSRQPDSPPEVPKVPPLPPSTRSRTQSQAETPKMPGNYNGPSLLRKASLGAGISPSAYKDPKPQPQRPLPSKIEMDNGMPKRTRTRHRDSLDLDDLSDHSDVDAGGRPTKTPMTPKSTSSVSYRTRELIDFLSEGPPEPPQLAPPVELQKAKSGKFRSMVSRLARGPSSERLVSRPSDSNLGNGIRTPPPSVRPSPSASASLNAIKARSIQNLPYVPPPVPYYPRPSSPHSSSSNDQDSPEVVSNRKAIPAWEQTTRADPEPRSPPTPVRVPPPSRPPVSKSSVPVTHDEKPETAPLPPPIRTQSLAPSVAAVTPSPVTAKSAPQPPRSPAALPRTPSGSVPLSIPRVHAADLRDGMAKATSSYECRILVDMFLARCGFQPPSEAQPIVIVPEEHNSEETSLVDILLGEGPFDSDDSSVDSFNSSPITAYSHPLVVETKSAQN